MLTFDSDPVKQEKKRDYVSNAFDSLTNAMNRVLKKKEEAFGAQAAQNRRHTARNYPKN